MSTTPEGPKAPSSIATPKLKRGFKSFFSDVKKEMKKVNWPTKKEATRLTGVVLAVTLLCVAILTGMSFAANTVLNLIVKGTPN